MNQSRFPRLILLPILLIILAIAPADSLASRLTVEDGPEGPPDSPVLYPPDPGGMIPNPIPVRHPAQATSGISDESLTLYDVETGQVTTIPLPEGLSSDELGIFNQPPPEIANPIGIGNPFTEPLGPDDFTPLSEIGDPSVWPWRGHVKLFVHYPAWGPTNFSHCSGVLIDPLFVLTAGHCVYTHKSERCTGGASSCYADWVRVYPGYESGNMPYGGAQSAQLYPFTGWINNGDTTSLDDMAIIRLNRHVGAVTSWYPIGYNTNDSWFDEKTFHNPGYPSEQPTYDGEKMYYWYGDYDTITDNIVYIETPYSKGGQSGSGAYYWDGGSSRTVYAVHSHITGGDDVDSGQTRMTQGKFEAIVSQVTATTPDTADLVALDVNVTPGTVPEGGSLSSMNYLVHNYSDASYNGSVNVNVYMSTNDNITTSDTLLQTHTLSLNLGPKSNTRVTMSNMPTIPYPTTGITRALGVILDISDANTWNNDSSTWDSAEINITNCNTPPAPGLVSPTSWTYTQDRTPYFDWSLASYADSYLLWVDNDPLDWANLVINATAWDTNFTPSSNLADDTYYWAVQGKDITAGCNIFGAWSEVWALVVDATAPLNPTLWSSTHSSGAWTNDNTITANWSGASDATSGVQGYGTYWSQGASDPPSATLDTSGASETSSPLSDGSWYFHLRTVDNAGNWAGAVHLGPFKIDTVAPSAWMTALDAVQASTSIQLNWGGSDAASGPDTFNVQYKVGSGAWTNWLVGTASNSATFGPSSPVTVTPGQTYYFRTATRDLAGNLGPYSTTVWTQIASYDEFIYLPVVIK